MLSWPQESNNEKKYILMQLRDIALGLLRVIVFLLDPPMLA